MKKYTLKIILVLTGTLLIGFALGMLTSAQIRNAHIKKFRSFSSADRFVFWTLHILDPTPEQREKILPVIRKYAAENNKLREEYREDFIDLMKNFKKDLYPYLTDEQKQRIEHISHGPQGPKDHQGRRGSPPPGRGPAHAPGMVPCPR